MESEARWAGKPEVLGSKHWHGPLVAASMGGLQFAWGFQQAYITVTLLNLGIDQSNLALLWLVAPLAGLTVQPLVGMLSDKWISNYGRRRPFILCSTFASIASLFAFGWAQALGNISGVNPKYFAVGAFVVLDVAINACNAAIRALMVDTFAPERQRGVTAWAARFATLGHLFSYGLCSIPLANKLPFASTQIQAVVVISSLCQLLTAAITCLSVSERQLVARSTRDLLIIDDESTISRFFKGCYSGLYQYWRMTRSLDQQLAKIFAVQTFSWYAWFTFLFYGSAWAGLVWKGENPNGDTEQQSLAGAKALFIFSVVSSVLTILLPLIKCSIEVLWSLALLIYAMAAFATGFVNSYTVALICFSAIGITWAASEWVPFALVGRRILELPHPHEPALQVGAIDEESQQDVQALLNVAPPDPDANIHDQSSDLEHDAQAAVMSGAYMGLHNTAITLPQFLSSFGSFLIFQYTSSAEHYRGNNQRAIALTIQVGAIAAVLAAILALRLPRTRLNE